MMFAADFASAIRYAFSATQMPHAIFRYVDMRYAIDMRRRHAAASAGA